MTNDAHPGPAPDGRPGFTITEAATLLDTLYGMAGAVSELPSYSDQNFRVDLGDTQFVLKIANTAEPREVLDFQQQALLHVRTKAPELRLPEVIPAKDGNTLHTTPAHNPDAAHLVWLVSYLPGQLISALPAHPPGLLASLGSFMGRLDAALASFEHPAMHRTLDWDLQQASRLHVLLDYIKDSERKRLVSRFLERLEKQVAGRLAGLRRSVIHNDANDNNVLAAGAPDAPVINGIIDFGDMVYTYTIGELAIAITYAILGKPGPLETATYVLQGYHEAFPVTAEEIDVLFDLICLRLCTSVCMSARARSQAPDNAYLAVSEQPAWDMLAHLASIDPKDAASRFGSAL